MAYEGSKEYHLHRYYDRRWCAIAYLGWVCKECNTDKNLHIDHVDPFTKSFTIGSLWGVGEERFFTELDKCQLLCEKHHRVKTFTNGDNGTKYSVHGTISMYRNHRCRCDPCRIAWNAACRIWQRKKK